ncbi:MAG: nucleoside 2-deoxyribosyltransferase domain-containing protein [Actinomycetota bacterium]|nr:nucleoside 2-deoxyribosyltransferase domain-containing protein [Actinomycetota bacterium]
MLKIYLSGPIEGSGRLLPEEERTTWRERAKELLGEKRCYDPNTMIHLIEELSGKELRELEFELLDKSDIILVNMDSSIKATRWGTAMELGYALSKGKDVIAFGDLHKNHLFNQEIVYCDSLDKACELIHRRETANYVFITKGGARIIERARAKA